MMVGLSKHLYEMLLPFLLLNCDVDVCKIDKTEKAHLSYKQSAGKEVSLHPSRHFFNIIYSGKLPLVAF